MGMWKRTRGTGRRVSEVTFTFPPFSHFYTFADKKDATYFKLQGERLAAFDCVHP
jgi:hypothetical protein